MGLDFDKFVGKLTPHLCRIARAILGKEDGCDDVIQYVFVACWKYWQKGTPAADISRLATMITRNACLDTLRRAKRELQHSHGAEIVDSPADPPKPVALEHIPTEELSRFVNSLPEVERAVISLRFWGELTDRAIGEQLGLPQPKVSNLRIGIIKKIQNRFGIEPRK